MHNTNYLITILNLQGHIGEGCKPPDHAVLELNYRTDFTDEHVTESWLNQNITKRYDFNNISNDFTATPLWAQVCDKRIRRIEGLQSTQTHLNDYMVICAPAYLTKLIIIFNTQVKPNLCEKKKDYKPYWTQDLTRLWRDMVKSEKGFLKCPKNWTNRSDLRECFKQKQFLFDKALCNAERAYNRRFADEIEELNTSDPQMFWSYINRLGPRKQKISHWKYMITITLSLMILT